MATYTYDPAESRQLDFMRAALDDIEGCGYPLTGTGIGAEFADETYAAKLATSPNQWEATAQMAERLIARYARRATQFSGGAGQMQAQWGDRMTGLKETVINMRMQAPLTAAQTTATTRPVGYASDPYVFLPDDKRKQYQ